MENEVQLTTTKDGRRIFSIEVGNLPLKDVKALIAKATVEIKSKCL